MDSSQVTDSLTAGHQAMVFVHSRKDTGKTARTLVLKAQNAGEQALFDCSDNPIYDLLMREVKKSRNKCAHFLAPNAEEYSAQVFRPGTRYILSLFHLQVDDFPCSTCKSTLIYQFITDYQVIGSWFRSSE